MLKIEQLKADLAELRLKYAELKIASSQEIEGIDYEIFELKQAIVSNHNLLKYDKNIKSQIHKTVVFITHVEKIVLNNS
ncbi:hypothetical protein [Flavobacterium sp.]|uniref:hypothetical protein n=1 Tax=Flavobacterium sp. TaxID=239 RepID=UPI0031DBA552